MRKNQAHNQHFLFLKHQLGAYQSQAKQVFKDKHPRATQWLEKRQLDVGKIRQQSQRLLTGATLSSLLLLAAPASPAPLPAATEQRRLARGYLVSAQDIKSGLAELLAPLTPARIGHPDPDKEIQVSQVIEENLGIKAKFELEGQRLNHSLGYIGYEQHLARFPGDSVRLHDEWPEAGMAPGLGAWGYFANSAAELTPQLEAIEKYYAVVQTLYLPTWEKDLRFLRDWYKYRKVMIINVHTGAAVVAAIGDAGPANWTGKQFGGSPEVMHGLGFGGGPRKGKVLLLFVDDPGGQVPLGPVKAPIQLAPPQEV
jgi:hypothetical protein